MIIITLLLNLFVLPLLNPIISKLLTNRKVVSRRMLELAYAFSC